VHNLTTMSLKPMIDLKRKIVKYFLAAILLSAFADIQYFYPIYYVQTTIPFCKIQY